MTELEWKITTNLEWITFNVMADTYDDAVDVAEAFLDGLRVKRVEEV